MGELLGLTLFGSGIGFLVLLGLLFLALILSDLNENGYFATLSFIVASGLVYFWGDVSVFSVFTFKNIGMYLFIGFLFSLMRTYFKGKELSKDDKKYFELRDNVFRWWFLFPISAINWVCGHLLKDLYNFVYSKVEKLYLSIFNL